MDQVTEEIAHFIGLFHMTSEQGRLRQDYNEFKAAQAAAAPAPSPAPTTVFFNAPYTLNDPEPALRYIPFAPELVQARVYTNVTYTPPYVPVPAGVQGGLLAFWLPGEWSSTQTFLVRYEISPPGSVAAYLAQSTQLTDNDYVSVGGSGFFLAPITAAAQAMALDALLGDVAKVMPFAPAQPPGDGEEIGAFVKDAAQYLGDLAHHLAAGSDAAGGEASGADTVVSTFVAQSDTAPLEGRYVNGSLSDELPKLSDYLPVGSLLASREEDESAEAPPNQGVNGPSSSASGAFAGGVGLIDPSVQLDAGGNVLVNTAVLTNATLDGAVFAVAGDHVELNAILQVNAWSDSDLIGQYLADRMSRPFETTTAFNVAQFGRIDPASDADGSTGAAHPEFPQYWAVTEITGDLIFMNWIQQFNFVMDHDVHVMSSSGVATMVTTGENLVFNNISINELGNYYDLVLVGGSLYDANIISQTNVLLDGDLLGALQGFGTSGALEVSTSGNLLWNQASITNIGGANRFHDLTDDYRKAIDNHASGSRDLPGGVINDEAFAGLPFLRVLYVSGNICDLQYISQTNVLGDGDEVALAMHTAAAGAGADWTISTGSNVLVNSASILDLDTSGKTYVGGDQYSDELLVQSDIIRTDQVLEARNADALVNEAVAFLGDDLIGADHGGSHSSAGDAGIAGNPAYHDVMQTVVS